MTRAVKSLIVFLAVGLSVWLISLGVEALRDKPTKPHGLAWAKDVPVQYADIGGVKIRYISVGSGPTMVLLHTLRTQLDIYYKMIPKLASQFRVIAIDYPGHGWSDIPKAQYRPEDFYQWVGRALDVLSVEDATLAGISIGGTIALELAARGNPRVSRVISINPYDYHVTLNSGLKGSSVFARIMFTATDIPVVGETFMRLRNRFVERHLFAGGVHDPGSISDVLFDELSVVGDRPGHYRAFIRLLRHQQKWQEARRRYANISVPVLLIYGDQDWAPYQDRAKTESLIENVSVDIVEDGGHFLSLDQPEKLVALMTAFASR